MMISNHVALYIHIRAVSVLYLLSMKVPIAIAVAKTMNRTAIKRVENKIFLRNSAIGERIGFRVQKYSLFQNTELKK